ncbi:MAG: N-acetylmuramoyl-L-alanine amidase family protein [Anaerovoracaceae bacterium]|jgi:N-acetylmuramoyl-L-alanine amidase
MRAKKKWIWAVFAAVVLAVLLGLTACGGPAEQKSSETGQKTEKAASTAPKKDEAASKKTRKPQQKAEKAPRQKETQRISWNPNWEFAGYARIHRDSVVLYRSSHTPRKNITVAVNAGHGTSGHEDVYTLCHPDGSPKLVSGSTRAGETKAAAAAQGTTMADGTSEADVNLSAARILKKVLLRHGYDVLMIRTDRDAQLDTVARTVFANENADCHLALHYDSTRSDKGMFFLSVPDNHSYRSMEPVSVHWRQHMALGKAIIAAARSSEANVFGDGMMDNDLTQTSYSTVPSVDLEIGDEVTDHSAAAQKKTAQIILRGLNQYFRENGK